MKKAIKALSIQEAKTQLSRLVDRASKGEPFIITKAGKPLVKVIPIDPPVRTREWKLTKGTPSAVPQQGGRVKALSPCVRNLHEPLFIEAPHSPLSSRPERSGAEGPAVSFSSHADSLAPEVRFPSKVQRLGFPSGQIAVPEDFDEMDSAGIRQLFEGKDEG